ncbi:MAG: hypothetical protein U1E53_10885 [Dongiaceae bacterium]
MRMPEAVLAGLALMAAAIFCGMSMRGQAETGPQRFQLMTPHDNDVNLYVFLADTTSGHVSLCRVEGGEAMKKPECSPWSE